MRFRNFVQGDLSITDYCRRLKKMANDLGALGEVISDRTLVLNMIHGLNDRYAHVGALLPCCRPFPTFLEARMISAWKISHWVSARPVRL